MTWGLLTLVMVALWAAFWIPLLILMADDRGWPRWQGTLLGVAGPIGFALIVATDARAIHRAR